MSRHHSLPQKLLMHKKNCLLIEPCVSKEQTKNDLALKTSWDNSMNKEAEIVVPVGTKLKKLRVKSQLTNVIQYHTHSVWYFF